MQAAVTCECNEGVYTYLTLVVKSFGRKAQGREARGIFGASAVGLLDREPITYASRGLSPLTEASGLASAIDHSLATRPVARSA